MKRERQIASSPNKDECVDCAARAGAGTSVVSSSGEDIDLSCYPQRLDCGTDLIRDIMDIGIMFFFYLFIIFSSSFLV